MRKIVNLLKQIRAGVSMCRCNPERTLSRRVEPIRNLGSETTQSQVKKSSQQVWLQYSVWNGEWFLVAEDRRGEQP